MGVDGFALGRDVARALIREGVIEKGVKSQRDLTKVQAAFNQWRMQCGRSLSQISDTCLLDRLTQPGPAGLPIIMGHDP